MSTFQVTNTPSKIYLGEQPDVSLVNDGPFTVYLGADSSVSVESGIELPPTGQISWQHGNEIWAVTKTILNPVGHPTDPSIAGNTSAFLRTSSFANLSVTTRAKFFKPLYRYAHPATSPSQTGYIETGYCNTLYLQRSVALGVSVLYESVIFVWYDENLVEIATEGIQISQDTQSFGAANQYRARVPVKGKYLVISFEGSAGGGAGSYPVSVFGSDIALPYSAPNGCSIPAVGSVTMSQWNLTLTGWTTGGTVVIPSPSSDMTVYGLNPGGAATNIGLFDRLTASPVDFIQIPAGAAATKQWSTSPRRAYYVRALFGAAANITFNIAWSNYE